MPNAAAPNGLMLSPNRINLCDVSGGARTFQLPVGFQNGEHDPVSCWVAPQVGGGANLVSVFGTIKGVKNTTLQITTGLTMVEFAQDRSGSWWPVAQTAL